MKKILLLIICTYFSIQGQNIKIEKLADLPSDYFYIKAHPNRGILVLTGNVNPGPATKILHYDTLGVLQNQYPANLAVEFSFGVGNSAVLYSLMKYIYVEDCFKYLNNEKTYSKILKLLENDLTMNPEPYVFDKYGNTFAVGKDYTFDDNMKQYPFLIKNNMQDKSIRLDLDSNIYYTSIDSYRDQIHLSSYFNILILDTSLSIIKEIPITQEYQRDCHHMPSFPNWIVSVADDNLYILDENYQPMKVFQISTLGDYIVSTLQSDSRGNLYFGAIKKTDRSKSLWKISFPKIVTEVNEDLLANVSVFTEDSKIHIICNNFQKAEMYDLMGRREAFETPEIKSNMQGIVMLFVHTKSGKINIIKTYINNF